MLGEKIDYKKISRMMDHKLYDLHKERYLKST